MNITDQMLESLYSATTQTRQGIVTLIPAIENLARGDPRAKEILSIAAKYKKVDQLMLEIQKDLKKLI